MFTAKEARDKARKANVVPELTKYVEGAIVVASIRGKFECLLEFDDQNEAEKMHKALVHFGYICTAPHHGAVQNKLVFMVSWA